MADAPGRAAPCGRDRGLDGASRGSTLSVREGRAMIVRAASRCFPEHHRTTPVPRFGSHFTGPPEVRRHTGDHDREARPRSPPATSRRRASFLPNIATAITTARAAMRLAAQLHTHVVARLSRAQDWPAVRRAELRRQQDCTIPRQDFGTTSRPRAGESWTAPDGTCCLSAGVWVSTWLDTRHDWRRRAQVHAAAPGK